MILVFGSLNIDLVAQVPAIPGPGRTVLAPSYRTHFGGKGANQAVAAARMAGPNRVRMAGRVGRDGFGDGAIENLKANGVDVGLVVRADEPTGCAFITVDQAGENAITVASGANMTTSVDDLPAEPFSSDTVLVLQMELPFAQALAAARRTASASGTVIWNLAPVPEKMTRETVTELLAVTDHLLVNEHEALDAAAAIGGADIGLRNRGRGARQGRKSHLHRDRRCARRAGRDGRGDPPARPRSSHHAGGYDRSRRYLCRRACGHAQ